MRRHFSGKENQEGANSLVFNLWGEEWKICEIPALRCNEDGRSNQTENQNKDDIQIQIAGATCKENDQSNQIENIKRWNTNTNGISCLVWRRWWGRWTTGWGTGTRRSAPSQSSWCGTSVGELSIKAVDEDKVHSYEMSWFPEQQPLEKENNSSSHYWPWLVWQHPSFF